MTAIDRLDAWLRISPSTVLPVEVLEYLDDIKAEDAELRKDNDRLIQAVEDLHDVKLEDQLVQLENENEKLREEVELVGMAGYLLAMKQLKAENAKLRDWCSELLHMAESNDPDFLHWPEIHDELRKLGVKIVKL